MKMTSLCICAIIVLVLTSCANKNNDKEFYNWALTPPMGWNSWDCYGPTVNEQEVKAVELLGTAITKDISTEKIWGFTGTYIGMYASGNGKSNVNPADFDWFDFEEESSLI